MHVHEPFAPSTASAALRHSRALNIGSFHAPTERLLSTQVARRFVELFFGRLDARIASYAATAALMASHFPAEYRVILPIVDARRRRRARAARGRAADRLRRRGGARRPARSCARCAAWATRATGRRRCSGPAAPRPPALRADLRERVTLRRGRRGASARALLAAADVVVLASAGALPAPGLALAAIGAGAVPLASRIEVYEELLAGGERGLLFEPGDVDTLAAQLRRLARHARCASGWRDAAEPLRALPERRARRRRARGGL